MKNIVLIGGTASGKTTLAKELHSKAEFKIVSGGKYIAGIPMTISEDFPELLTLPADEYIKTVLSYQGEVNTYAREEMDRFCKRLGETYGVNIIAKILYGISITDTSIIDNVSKVENVNFFKDKGFLIVGLDCPLETRIKRAFLRNRPEDPKTLEEIRQQIQRTDEYFDIEHTLPLSDILYNTESIRSDDPTRIQDILSRT